MIFLKSIHLAKFKGIEDLTIQFDDLTILAGLNNSGKTSVLEAIHILVTSLPGIVENRNMFHENVATRIIDLQRPLATIGVPNPIWLIPYHDWDSELRITGTFDQGLEISILRLDPGRFAFEVIPPPPERSAERLQELTQSVQELKTELIVPPGVVSSQEELLPGPRYDDMVRDGKATQYWRNSIWWSIQDEGLEQFESVRALVDRHFPDIELSVPVLDRKGNPPAIQFKYKQLGKGPLDIAQSGSGLRTFMTLARSLEQSSAQIVLFDEPDAHLHASQQTIVLDLLMDAACNSNRQVIVATHSPEFLSRAPSECIRWVERNGSSEQESPATLLMRLGATPDMYLPPLFPDVIVYVEGKRDRPFIESLIRCCRRIKGSSSLPTTLVIPHKDGRFDAVAVQSLARLVSEINASTAVVGIRDLDWYYGDTPDEKPDVRTGTGWLLLDLPCKELENLLCDVELLYLAYEGGIERDALQTVLNEESNSAELIDEWRVNVQPRIREWLENRLDPTTREKRMLETFAEWTGDSNLRARLVAGRLLLGKVRERIKRDHGLSCYPNRMFDRLPSLTPTLAEIAEAIFPGHPFPRIE